MPNIYAVIPRAGTNPTAPLLPISYTIIDEFTYPDATALAGLATQGTRPKVWSVVSSVNDSTTSYQVNGNAAAPVGNIQGHLFCDIGSTDAVLSATINALLPTATSRRAYLLFRYAGYKDYFQVSVGGPQGAFYRVEKLIANALTTLHTSTIVPTVGDVVTVEMVGAVATIKVNGTTMTAITMTELLTATKAGFSGRQKVTSGTTDQDPTPTWARFQATVS